MLVRNSLSFLILVAVLISAALTAGATPPELSPLFLLPGDRAPAPAAGLQEQPAIAAGGPGYLAVWTDGRAAIGTLVSFTGGPFFAPDGGTMRDIYAARLDASGNLIDPMPTVVTRAALNQGDPAVAWNGENWLIVWMGQTGISCCSNINIYAARVSPGGVVLDDPPILVDADPTMNGLYWPTVASDGADWAVAWRDLDQGAGIFTIDGARISAAGVVLDPGGKRLRRDSFNSYPVGPELAFAGDEYLLAWTENSGVVRGQRLTPALDRVGPVFRINLYSPSTGLAPRVATDGVDYFVAWFEDRYYGWAQAFGARVSHSGVVLDPAGIALAPYSGYTQFAPSVAWDGTNWLVAYNRQVTGFDDDIYVTRVSPAGVVVDPTGIEVAGGDRYELTPWIAPLPAGGAAIVWQQSEASTYATADIAFGSISAAGTPGPSAIISLGAPRQRQPQFAWNGDGYLAVFGSETSGLARILGQRIAADGTVLDVEPFLVASSTSELGAPAVAWDGMRYLVAWSDPVTTRILARRVALDGTFIDATPIDVMPGSGAAVAAMDHVFLMTGTHAANPHFRYPYGMRIRGSDGARLDPSPVLLGSYFATWIAVVQLGSRWLVAWQQNPTHDDSRSDIWANFVTAGGTPGASFPVTSTGITIEGHPALATSGDIALISWENDPTGAYNDDLLGRRIRADGSFADGVPLGLSTSPGLQFDPATTWTGSEYVVAFGDLRNSDPNGPYVSDIYAARVTANGSITDPDGFAVADDLLHAELEPGTASGGGGAIIGVIDFREEDPFFNYRIGYRLLNPLVTSVAEAGADKTIPAGGDLHLSPNPTSGTTSLRFTVFREGATTVGVYDVLGREVRRLFAGPLVPGTADLTWDGRDEAGVQVSRGAYFVRVRGDGSERSAKVVVR